MDLLYIEDDPVDFKLLVRHLQRQGMEADVVRVDDAAGLEAALAARPWDAVLADYNVPGFHFRDLLARLKASLPDCPIILVSGSVGEEPAVELMREGIWDFVLKDNLARLCPAIERSVRDSVQRRDRRRAEQALQESEERFRLIAATVTGAIWMADVEHRQVLYVSPGYERIWQRSCASLYENPRSFLDGVHAEDIAALLGEMRAARCSGRPYAVEYRVLRPDGSQRWVMGRGFPVASPSGRTERYVGVVEDVTERHQADERLRQAATVFESTREAVVIVDLDRRVLAVNKAFTEITGYTEAEALGKEASRPRASRHGPEFFEVVWAHLADTDQWQGEMWNRRKNGEVYPAWASIATVRDEHGVATHHVAVFSDISELKRNEQELARLAHYDALTGLPNRLLLQSRLEHAIDRAARHRQRAAVLFIDLDHFKKINESLGHVVGDQLLVDVAARLKSRVREEDTLGRFGSDEFLVLVEPLHAPDEAALLARDLLALLAEPFRLEGSKESFIGASIGISIFPDDGDSVAELLRDADTAKYQAKERGRNRFCFYTADMNLNAMAQLELEAALRRALERDEFVLHYQPKVDLTSGRIVGAEALIRWQREGIGLEPPARFIPLAERTGLIVPMGSWAIDEACRQLARWRDADRPGLRLAVNVSGLQFHTGDLVDEVARALARHSIPPAWLELELTESMLMADPEQTILVLRQLKALGVKLSLDDFGTGYSSLAYLSRFPIDTLKIDRSFVRDIVTEPQAAMIAVSIIDLAHRMRLSVVAEGVETEPQLGYLRMRGCDEMQGYYFARPLPAPELDAMVGAGRQLPVVDGAALARGRSLLLVEADAAARAALATLLAPAGYRVLAAEDWIQALETLAIQPVQVVIADQRLPGMNGTAFFRRVKDLHPATVRMMLADPAERAAVAGVVEDGTVYGLLYEPWEGDTLVDCVRDAFLYHESVIRPRLLRRAL